MANQIFLAGLDLSNPDDVYSYYWNRVERELAREMNRYLEANPEFDPGSNATGNYYACVMLFTTLIKMDLREYILNEARDAVVQNDAEGDSLEDYFSDAVFQDHASVFSFTFRMHRQPNGRVNLVLRPTYGGEERQFRVHPTPLQLRDWLTWISDAFSAREMWVENLVSSLQRVDLSRIVPGDRYCPIDRLRFGEVENPNWDHGAVVTPCNHLYGRDCLKQSLLSSNLCPICRQPLEQAEPQASSS
ncbi:hypothetical protein BU23DRAFT_572336 [Bimuria novae-zelandiae CBS 107.79]|uniref:RING-type domain-containing protein n=1 Tax=Bimuria novae-zelandiae CBS 107.79 TaxID=1447943 RepID=A0A6A5UUQ7_9PLEO|nr:hypothetical protein BU23DRAFT_572336 [Bimuria novae-zelandiae CBS 107.79]